MTPVKETQVDLECYEAWKNKEQLEKLVEKGQIPRLDYVKQLNAGMNGRV